MKLKHGGRQICLTVIPAKAGTQTFIATMVRRGFGKKLGPGFRRDDGHWLASLSFLVLLATLATPAHADPSFDCAKASTTVEKTICVDENQYLAYRDTVLAELFAAMKEHGGHEVALAGQSAWLQARNTCGADVDCLTTSYDARIAELARAAGDETGVTGSYAYNIKYDSEDTNTEPFFDVGDAFVYRDLAGELHGYISTVSGPTFHTCDLGIEEAAAMGDAWLFTDTEENKDFDGRLCRVLIRQDKQSLRIDSIGCGNWCGARGYFDNTYTKNK